MVSISVDEGRLQAWVGEAASRHEVPGVAVGVLHNGREQYAFHGVTSVENPLAVDANTLFQFGSTGKTFTVTAIMQLVERGAIGLTEPVRKYVPELVLADEEVARTVTVKHLLNHTAGWGGDLHTDTGNGDDALAKYVELMARLPQLSPPGKQFSYNNASLSLAGRIIEHVTGRTYEQAIKEMLLEPLELAHTFFFNNEIMTRRFAAGHKRERDGSIHVTRPWALARSGNPAGGMSANAGDQIAWARFHLGDGRAPDGTRVISADALRVMRQPTFEMRGGAIGDAVGLGWLLRDVGGVRLVSHGGTTIGHYSSFMMVPERGWSIASLTNCGPNGPAFNGELRRWALENYLGVRDEVPEPVARSAEELAEYAGTYETIAVVCTIDVRDDTLMLHTKIRPEVRAELGEDAPDEQPPVPLGLLEGPGDRFVTTGGNSPGSKGYFARDESGRIEGVHIGGRMAMKTA